MKTKFSLREAIALMLTATLGTQLLNAAMILVQGRLYVPSSVGYVANVVSFAIILEPICMLQLPYALPQQISDKRAVQLVAATLLSTLCISLLLGSGALIAYILLPPRRQTLTMVLLGIVLMYTIVAFDVTLLWSAREGRFRSLGGQNVTLAALRALIQLVGGIANSSFTWLLLSEGAGRIGAIFAIQPSRLISVIKQLRPIKISDIKAVLIENWRFPLISVPSTFADNLGGYLPPILITDLYGLQAAGLLFMAQRAVTLPIVLLTRSTADAIHVRSAQILNERPSDLRSFVLRTSIVLAGVGTVAMGGMAAALWILWPLAFSHQWDDARQLAYELLLPIPIQCVSSPLSRILMSTNRQQFKLLFDATFLVAGTSPLLAWAVGFRLQLHDTVWMLSAGYGVAYILYYVLIVTASLHPLNIKNLGPLDQT